MAPQVRIINTLLPYSPKRIASSTGISIKLANDPVTPSAPQSLTIYARLLKKNGEKTWLLGGLPHHSMVLGNSLFLCFVVWLFVGVFISNPAWGAEVSLLAIEVTQGLQAISHDNPLDPAKNNTVPLVRGKRTFVRAYLSGGGYLKGALVVTGGSIAPSMLISNNFGPISGELVREQIESSLNFELPDWLIDRDEISIGPLMVLDNAVTPQHPPITCSNCGSFPILSLPTFESPPLRVRLIGVQYSDAFGSYPVGEAHYKLIRSWLKRTFPVNDVVSPFVLPSTQEDGVSYESTRGNLFEDTDGDGKLLETCGRVNGQIFDLRETDLDTHETNIRRWSEIYRTRYVGLLSDLGFYTVNKVGDRVPVFAPGCITGSPSPNSELVSSAPVGVGRSEAFPWDNDGSYGDWSTSHELGHTFGKLHPTIPDPCGATTDLVDEDGRVSPQFPNDPRYAGLDFGDWISLTTGGGVLLPMKAVPGNWYDFMSYCPTSLTTPPTRKWIGPDTYTGIREILWSSEFSVWDLSGTLISDSSPPSTIYMYENKRPPSLPPRELKGGFTECFRDALDNPRGVLECLRKEGGSGAALILRDSKDLALSAAHTEMAASPETLEGSHLPGISEKKKSKFDISVAKGRFIRVVASVDLSASEGRITYARQVTLAPGQPNLTDPRILLRVTDRKGNAAKKLMVFHPHSDAFSQKRQRGIATAVLPLKEQVAKIELFLEGKPLPVDEITVSDQPLPPLIIDPLNSSVSMAGESEKNSLPVTWNLSPDPPPIIGKKITYAVQMSYDKGDSWQTIGIGLRQNRFELPTYRVKGFDHVQIKVIANDRFQTSEGKLTLVGAKPKP